ncbi:hypothetical protein HPL003_01960 [Paenibacillus terrae HPL-003]|uniref:FAD:protein FMN transferase n=1 Tax=Paenibacillus terrae (strain HPL-003) TaxID=985665 RepID=G7VXZ8_PAETH|nr:FAD:protein FMN transferase [Paenibacillus terrae]AET57176.1 hypothetical protein HPL003_01960 [Paenibacillus terrae HPL-003]
MNKHSKCFQMMGTIINLCIYHENGDYLLNQAHSILRKFESRYTINKAYSELIEVNQNSGIQAVTVGEDLYDLVKLGKEVSINSNGIFNIAIGPLVKLWNIGFKNARLPSKKEIRDCLSLINPQKIELNDSQHSIHLMKMGMAIDLGAIAKGYFADQLKQFFTEHGVKNGLIDLGGNVLSIGSSPVQRDGYWHVGIQNPFKSRGNIIGVVLTKDRSVVTSGIYERYFHQENNTYHHILDSKTGYPLENDIASVTIISDNSVAGEIWTTLGFADLANISIKRLNAEKNIEGIIIAKDGKMFVTSGLMADHSVDTEQASKFLYI